jgi:cell division GTPase FtsZ
MSFDFPNRLDYTANPKRKKKRKSALDKKKKKVVNYDEPVFKVTPPKEIEPNVIPRKQDIKKQEAADIIQKKGKVKKATFIQPNIDRIIKKVKEEGIMKKAINFGIVGLGQGGCRIAYEFEKIGYPTIAINTSSQDLDKVDCKVKVSIGQGGAGKDLRIGAKAVNTHRNKIMEVYRREFKTVDHAIICAGSSGGTGGGGLKAIAETLTDYKLPVGVLTTFPLKSEDTRAKKNTLSVLNELVKMQNEKKIRPLIIIDNSKIEEKHPGLSTLKFWNVANDEVVKTFDVFNKLSATSTAYTSLDPADYTKIMTSGGCMIFGNISITEPNGDKNEAIFADAIEKNINSGLLVEGFNLVQATHCGCIIVANAGHLEKIPRKAEEAAFSTIMELIGSGSVYKGVYALPQLENPEVFFMLSGLSLPEPRVRELIDNVRVEVDHFQEKAEHKTVTDIMADMEENEQIDLDQI